MELRKLLILLAISFLFLPTGAVAAPTTPEDARLAVESWLGLEAKPLEARLGGQVRKVITFRNDSGEPIYHIVYLNPIGFIIVSGDDLVEPVAGFSSSGTYNRSWQTPLGALVDGDLSGRVSNARREERSALAESRVFEPANHMVKARNRWDALKSTSLAPKGLGSLDTVSDVRVSPLVKSKWNQSTVAGSACYNYYTPPGSPGNPGNYYSGCTATAGAQLMRYHSYPTSGVGTDSYDYFIGPWYTKIQKSGNLRGGDGAVGPYEWAEMPLVPDSSTSVSQCEQMGSLLWDVGIASNMDYDTSGSGAFGSALANALRYTFFYNNAVFGGSDDIANIPGSVLINMINPDLDASFPVSLGINSPDNAYRHSILADGYGYAGAAPPTLYHHLNMGWAGLDDLWYNLPYVDTGTNENYTIVHSCIYNVYPTGSGEIISGRVTDAAGAPLSGITITADESGGGTYTTTTNSRGIYALAMIPSDSSYTICAAKSGYDFGPAQIVSTQTSIDESNTVGNVWGVNFRGTYTPSVNRPVFSHVYQSGVTLTATITNGGGSPVTDSGVVYGTGANPSVSGGVTVSTSPLAKSGTFSVNVTGLTANTLYHFQGYATNSVGTGYTADGSFATPPGPPAANAATAISTTGFTANWTAPPGTAAIAQYRLDVATDSNFISKISGYNNLLVPGTSRAVAGLSAGKPYYYRVRAVNAGGAGTSSNIITATTYGPPTVDKPAVSSITTGGATLGATIESNGGQPVTSAGAAYGTSANPTISGRKETAAASSGAFTIDVTDLASNTLYHFRGYAANSTGLPPGYTVDKTFTTVPDAPTATAATALSASGFTAHWTAPPGTAAITQYRLDVAGDSGFSSMVSGFSNLPVTGTSRVVTGLSTGNPYYYRVRAVNAGGASTSSNIITATTYAPPTVDEPTMSSITTSGATLGATIESNRGWAITSTGVAYGTSANPTTSSAKAAAAATSGAFTVNVTGLVSNKLFHFRGYAVNSTGLPGYTADTTFTTVSGPPKATAATALSTSGFNANWTAPPGTAAIAGYQLDVATDSGFSSMVMVPGYSNLPVTGTSGAVTGLSAGKSYYYRVRALNAGGTSQSSNIIRATTF